MLSTVTSKGQITIPVEVRRAAGLDAGTQVEFIVNARNRIELVPRHTDIRALRGAVARPGQPVTVDAMKEAIAEGWLSAGAPAAHEPPATYAVDLLVGRGPSGT